MAIIFGDFEQESSLGMLEKHLQEHCLPMRYMRFGETFRSVDEVAQGLSRVDSRAFIDVQMKDRSLRISRSNHGLGCANVARYAVQMLPLLHYLHAKEPQDEDPFSSVKCLPPIFFCRHGESEYNKENRLGGNPLLTKEGVDDALAMGEFFQREVLTNPRLFEYRTRDPAVRFGVWTSEPLNPSRRC
jgi:hypothetical protein